MSGSINQIDTTNSRMPASSSGKGTAGASADAKEAFENQLNRNNGLNINTGSGDDVVQINGFSGSANIDTGSGDDTVIIGGSPFQPEPPAEPQQPASPSQPVEPQQPASPSQPIEPSPPPVQSSPLEPEGDGDGDGGDGDPLVLDMDRDGIVEATAGMGVDIDGDGTVDGAASGGDKMLAMTDLNGNGQIDGTEVFGNETINPFTGLKMDAANGFEALRIIAESAEEHTGIDCLDADGNVDIEKLKDALESIGVGLGLISDGNNTTLESLGDVAAISTNYVEQDDSGDVQHRQLGNYSTSDGQVHKADDVWFKS